MWEHLSGQSYRSLGTALGSSAATLWRGVHQWLNHVPHCFDITRLYCERFCHILLVDGKYVKVGRYGREIPVLYGIDYLTHDIPGYRLSPSESYLSWLKYFSSLKLAQYNPSVVVCDDNENIRRAAIKVFPAVIIQLCHRHYLVNTRALLDTKNNPNHRVFAEAIKKLISRKRSPEELQVVAGRLVRAFKGDVIILGILADLERRAPLLFAYMKFPRTPRTTNLIECFNSHLEGRLKTIKGFSSFQTADSWLNGYFLKRRLNPFKDCGRPFKKLNGHCSLELTLKHKEDLNKLMIKIRRPF